MTDLWTTGLRRLSVALSCLTLFFIFALTPSPASAVETRFPLGFSPITGSGSGVTTHFLSGIAVDETSGNVFLNDGTGGNVVDILGAEGGVPVGLASPFQLTGFVFEGEQSGAAVDNSATSSQGTLYVADVINRKLKKFVRNAGTEKYEAAGDLIATPAFGEVVGVAVDPFGNIFVADWSHFAVVKFSPTGTELARIDTTATVGRPSSVAVDSAGDLFVQAYNGAKVVKYPANGSGEIESAVFTQILLPTGATATAVATDRATNRLYIALGNRVAQYDATTLAKQLEFGAGALTTTTRLTVNSVDGRIYVADNGTGKKNVAVFGPTVIVPGVKAAPATGVTGSKANLSGTVNPDNVAVSECKFEYLTDAAYKANGNGYAGASTKPCEGAIPTDGADHPVTAALTGLTGNGTTYHFRLSATNANGANSSNFSELDRTFTTGNTAVTTDATNNSGTKATLNGDVFPDNAVISECKFEYGTTIAYGFSKPCEGAIPADEGQHPVTAALTNLQPNGTTYHFRVVVNGTITGKDKFFTTPDTVITGAASGVAATTATANGTVKADGVPLTECKFEYGTTTAYSASQPCIPPFGSIPNDSSFHAVSADLTGLDSNAIYHYRLVAANANGPIAGDDATFTTLGPPQISEEAATGVTQSAASMQAKVNPSGFATTYHFEWGTDDSYGNRLPPSEDPAIGSGTAPVTVSAPLAGLQLNSPYHFRVVATNSAGTTVGPDYEFITLNAAGLPDNRRFELVSPPDKRPQGAVGTSEVGGSFVTSQVADDGQSVAFPLLGGVEGTNSGGDASYLAERSSGGWQSMKISPPSLVPAPTSGLLGNASTGFVVYNSADLSCGVINTFNPLTEDTPVADVELGVYNLYRRNPDGSHTLITSPVPANPGIAPFNANGFPAGIVAGASEDCGKVYFRSPYQYLPGASGFYEWDEGTLRDAGRLPNGAVPTGTVALGGEYGEIAEGQSQPEAGSRLNSVSRDGSRFFFSATSTTGKKAVFVRKDAGPTVEASAKQGGAKDSLGARYETASPDGSHVFFTATYGLTPDSSSSPTEDCSNTILGSVKACDLYDYDVDSGELNNLSANTDPANSKGASVQGVIAVSDDGSLVYFSARGQLIPGKGKTYSENTTGAGSVNVYLARDDQLSYVATIAASDTAVLVRGPLWSAEVTPDGGHLLFASTANVTGYNSGGVAEAYLYSADTGTTRCVSCRPDGLPPTKGGVRLLLGFPRLPSRQWQTRKMSEDGSRVFFVRSDILVPGAVSGNNNIYEWERGQIHLVASGPVRTSGFEEADFSSTEFYGVSRSGDDAFFSTVAQLDPHDTDFAKDVYDARVGGGFPPPPPPRKPCVPAEDECQGTPMAQPPSPGTASADVSGPGNPPKKECGKRKILKGGKCMRKPCPQGKVLKRGKCVKKNRPDQKKSKQRKQRRAAGANHGGAK